MSIACKECDGSGELTINDIIRKCHICNGKGTTDTVYFYIDQNIISDLRKGYSPIDPEKSFIQYIYSNYTLVEILKAEASRQEEYLKILRKFKARKIFERVDTTNIQARVLGFDMTNKRFGLIEYADPEVFLDFCKQNENYHEDAMELSAVLFYSTIIEHLGKLLGLKVNNFNNEESSLNDVIGQIINDIRKIREFIDPTNCSLNNCRKSENPINAIWSEFINPKINEKYKSTISEDVFWGWLHPLNHEANYLLPHTILSVIGYQSDSLKKLKKSPSNFLYDLYHVDLAGKGDVFWSYDKKLCLRAAALYFWKHDLMTVIHSIDETQNQILYTYHELFNHD